MISVSFLCYGLAIALFCLGFLGCLVRRNTLIVLMCLELMLNAVNLIFVEVSMRTGDPNGIVMVIFVIAIAAAEAGVGLALALNLYRVKGSLDLESIRSLRG